MNSTESAKEQKSMILEMLLILVIVISSMCLTLEDAPQVYKNLHRIIPGTDFEFRYVLIGRIIPYVTVLGCMVGKARRFLLGDDDSCWHVLSHFLKLIVAVWITLSTRRLFVRIVMETFPWIVYERTIGGISWLYVLKDLAFFVLFALNVNLCDWVFKLCSGLCGRLQRLERN